MAQYDALAEQFKALEPVLNELARRRWAATEALAIGRGGIRAVVLATGLSRKTIRAGIREGHGEAPSEAAPAMERRRRAGAGRQRRVERELTLLRDREALVESTTRGDPQSPWRWTGKSVRRLAAELQAQGHRISPQLVSELLRGADDRLQGTRKTREGGRHPDRDAQFEPIATLVRDFHTRGQPVISVDTKQKELVGDDKNAGRASPPKGQPPAVRVYDCIDPKHGNVTPYGVYDVGAHVGWVSVGIDHDTPAFAVATTRAWWLQRGSSMYPKAKELLIIADMGQRNGYPRVTSKRFPRQTYVETLRSGTVIKSSVVLNETEIKIGIGSDDQVSEILALCRVLYSDGGQINQHDEYFDTREENLKEQDFAVRLRSVNGNLKVALKGPRIYLPDNVYQRIELEFSAANELEVREQLASQGLVATAVIEKQRWVFTGENAEIAIDRLPFIGSFIEVEGDTPSAIETVLASLQLSSKDAVRENYSELLEAKFKEIGLPARPGLQATFEAEAQWRRQA